MVKKTKGWDLPHSVKLLETQENFLKSHYGPPTNVDPKELLPEMKRKIEASSPLAKSRFDEAEWLKVNYRLYKKALQIDEKAFQELISRDPRYLCSDLGLFYISRWRVRLDFSHALTRTEEGFGRFKHWINRVDPEHRKNFQFSKADFETEEALNEFSHPRSKLAREQILEISRSLLKAFEERGFRSAPPEVHIKPWYFAALILFSGLKKAAKPTRRHTAGDQIERLRQAIAGIPESVIRTDVPEGFLLYIRAVACVIPALGEQSGEFQGVSIARSSPSNLAAELVGVLFGVSPRTVLNCIPKKAQVRVESLISWPSVGKMVAVNKVPMSLETYPPVADILRRNS